MENLCNHQMPVAKYRSLEVFRSKACGRWLRARALERDLSLKISLAHTVRPWTGSIASPAAVCSLANGEDNGIYVIELLWGLNERRPVTCWQSAKHMWDIITLFIEHTPHSDPASPCWDPAYQFTGRDGPGLLCYLFDLFT
jgi:hypothetical protein